jgi:hypothetical protein
VAMARKAAQTLQREMETALRRRGVV